MTDVTDLYRLEERLKIDLQALLNGNLVGIYLHGSLAFGCFRRDVSDIDYLVVVKRPLTHEVKRKLMDSTLELDQTAPPKGLEMSVVLHDDCLQVHHPVPFQLHYSRLHTEWYQRDPDEYVAKMRGVDPDLVAYFAVIRQCGIRLCGAPIADVFGEIPPEFVADSFRNNLEDGDEPSAVLNRCRYEAYRRNGVLLSKPDGGLWGLRHLPETEHGAIRAAILRYLPLEIRALRTDELHSPLFNHFNRHQEVTECWRKENGKWRLKPLAFVEEWDRSKLDAFYAELRETIIKGGAVFAAFVGNSLIGFAAVERKLFGHAHKYVQMTELHVSYEWRGCGIGRKLFGEICRQARIYGAERLYISGHSSEESQAFYHALGCVEAVEYNDVIWAAEPCDCQLEYDLKDRLDQRAETAISQEAFRPGGLQSPDYEDIRDFLLRLASPLFTFARWDWMIAHPLLDHKSLEKIGLWRNPAGEVCAAALFDCQPGETYLLARPEYRDTLYPEMIEYAMRNLNPGSYFSLVVEEQNHELQYAVSQAGFVKSGDTEAVAVFDSQKTSTDYALPDGLTITDMEETPEAGKFAQAICRGFEDASVPALTAEFEALAQAGLNRPHVNRALKIAVLAPDRTIVCTCGLWRDARSHFAVVEPLATVPEFRKLGLARAAVYEGIRRVSALGTTRVLVGSDQAFYYKIGFSPLLTAEKWKRR